MIDADAERSPRRPPFVTARSPGMATGPAGAAAGWPPWHRFEPPAHDLHQPQPGLHGDPPTRAGLGRG